MSNKKTFPHQIMEGEASRQAHADMPKGTFEREMGSEGFFGPATHFYHRRPPTGWTSFEGPLRPRAFDCTKLDGGVGPLEADLVLHNGQVQVRFWRCAEPMRHLARNQDGDDLLFVHNGAADLYCDFGRLPIEAGDYVVIPRGTMWRLQPSSPIEALLIENTNGRYGLPDRGMVGPHAVFDPAVLDHPRLDEAFRAQPDDRAWTVRVKRCNALSSVTYAYNPLDAVGWKGDLTVLRLNVRDIRPLMSHRYHLPPSAHTTFLGDRFVVCTFAPRPFETDPGALKVPFFHNNDDYDEVLFYHRGDFFSRDNIDAGMITFHPAGFTHGPHPKALKNMLSQSKEATDEYAVMIDTRDPLDVAETAGHIEIAAYADSWRAD